MRIAALVLVAIPLTASADGYYAGESFGMSGARGEPRLSPSLHLRLVAGMRRGELSFEAWMAGDLTFDRDGARLGIFGGKPAGGEADLSTIGGDVKYGASLAHNLRIYVRGGPRVAWGDGALSGYRGPGVGAGTGVQLSGRVRALGFLWAPLFFLKRGPMATGALFLDHGIDVYRLYGMQTATVPLVSTSVGFSVGSDF